MPFDKELDSERPLEVVEGEQALATTVSGVEVTLDTSTDSEARKQARKFVDLVKSGEKPGIAAERVGTTLKRINSSQEMKAAVEALLEGATLDKKIRQMMVKAGLNKVFMEGVASESVKERKLALEAAKLISADENMAVPTDSSITINLSPELQGRIKDISLPGLEFPNEEKTEN